MYLEMILQEDFCAYYLLCQRGDNGGSDIIVSLCGAHIFIALLAPFKIYEQLQILLFHENWSSEGLWGYI